MEAYYIDVMLVLGLVLGGGPYFARPVQKSRVTGGGTICSVGGKRPHGHRGHRLCDEGI